MHRWAGLGCWGNRTLCATGSADLNIAPSWDSRHLMQTTNTSFEGFCFKTICIRPAQHITHGVSVYEVYSAHTKGPWQHIYSGSVLVIQEERTATSNLFFNDQSLFCKMAV